MTVIPCISTLLSVSLSPPGEPPFGRVAAADEEGCPTTADALSCKAKMREAMLCESDAQEGGRPKFLVNACSGWLREISGQARTYVACAFCEGMLPP